MLTLSSLSALLVSFILAVNAAPEVGTVFAVYPGWDMDNGSILTTLGGTELSCIQSCSASATCVAYTYVPYGSSNTGPGPACVFKSTVSLSTFENQSFDTSVGLVGACGTFTPVGPASCYTVKV